LRRWSHDKQDNEQVLTLSADPCNSDGSGPRERACLVPGGGRFDLSQDRCTPQTLHESVKKAEIDSGRRSGVPSDVSDRLKALEREKGELRQANETLCKMSAYFAMAELTAGTSHDRVHRRSPRGLWSRADLQGLPIAPSTYHAQPPSGAIQPGCRRAPGRMPS
jgi:transposase